MKRFFVYILCSRRNGTLYIGVTSDLIKRVYEHKNDLVDGFTKRYKVHNLIWYEAHETAESAIKREKNIKKWERSWKLKLIEKWNPEWNDLYCSICEDTGFPLNGLRERRLNKQTLNYIPTGMSEEPKKMSNEQFHNY